jgi:hypothetical protein
MAKVILSTTAITNIIFLISRTLTNNAFGTISSKTRGARGIALVTDHLTRALLGREILAAANEHC